jgi:hypothetical protein
MKLTKKHIGGLYNTKESDGSWVYQLVDVQDGWLLFYTFNGKFWKERVGAHKDWQRFARPPWLRKDKQEGWEEAEDVDQGRFL